ncbi:MAG: copper homeostasis protein CutC [Verrucomicrobiota bacterium]
MKIEICVDSVDGALAAENGGADRVELCDNLLEGGTTPSGGCIKLARERLRIGLQVIIRPRGGDFLYSASEAAVMAEDIQLAKALGADGVVLGALTAAGDIDLALTRSLIALARPMNVTFHRAFDMCRDPRRSLNLSSNSGSTEY